MDDRSKALDVLADAFAVFRSFSETRQELRAVPASALASLHSTDIPAGVTICVGDSWDDLPATLQCYPFGYFYRTKDILYCDCHIIEQASLRWDRSISLLKYVDIVRSDVERRVSEHGDVELIENEIGDLLRFRVRCDDGPLTTAYAHCEDLYNSLHSRANAIADRVADCIDSFFLVQTAVPIATLLEKVETTLSASDKGRALESLMCVLFESIDGFSVKDHIRTETEELDIVVANETRHFPFCKESAFLLVECKNWSTKCGREELSVLEGKLRNRRGRCNVGFLISWNGFSSTVSRELLRSSHDSIVVVPIDGAQIRDAVAHDSFEHLIREMFSRIVFS